MTTPTALAAPHSSLDEQKRTVRLAARQVLLECDPTTGQLAAKQIVHSRTIHPGMVVAGFWPLGHEIDIRPLLEMLRSAGHVVALPRTPRRGLPLSFHRWGKEDALEPERFGTMTAKGPEVTPDLLLVPMLAFTRTGHRLGYGGGYYDRTLAARPGVHTLGVAYSAQERPDLPVGPTDQPLQCIATEREFIVV